jgi:hypothetical protein
MKDLSRNSREDNGISYGVAVGVKANITSLPFTLAILFIGYWYTCATRASDDIEKSMFKNNRFIIISSLLRNLQKKDQLINNYPTLL